MANAAAIHPRVRFEMERLRDIPEIAGWLSLKASLMTPGDGVSRHLFHDCLPVCEGQDQVLLGHLRIRLQVNLNCPVSVNEFNLPTRRPGTSRLTLTLEPTNILDVRPLDDLQTGSVRLMFLSKKSRNLLLKWSLAISLAIFLAPGSAWLHVLFCPGLFSPGFFSAGHSSGGMVPCSTNCPLTHLRANFQAEEHHDHSSEHIHAAGESHTGLCDSEDPDNGRGTADFDSGPGITSPAQWGSDSEIVGDSVCLICLHCSYSGHVQLNAPPASLPLCALLSPNADASAEVSVRRCYLARGPPRG